MCSLLGIDTIYIFIIVLYVIVLLFSSVYLSQKNKHAYTDIECLEDCWLPIDEGMKYEGSLAVILNQRSHLVLLYTIDIRYRN